MGDGGQGPTARGLGASSLPRFKAVMANWELNSDARAGVWPVDGQQRDNG